MLWNCLPSMSLPRGDEAQIKKTYKNNDKSAFLLHECYHQKLPPTSHKQTAKYEVWRARREAARSNIVFARKFDSSRGVGTPNHCEVKRDLRRERQLAKQVPPQAVAYNHADRNGEKRKTEGIA
jgi:hypothetical protein